MDEQEARYMALKSGYISLRERLNEWRRQTTIGSEEITSDANDDDPHQIKENQSAVRQQARRQPIGGGQFATLQEFFQSKSRDLNQADGDRKQHHHHSHHHTRRKLPIMKLTKDDWNVKCWEERLSGKKRLVGDSQFAGGNNSNNNLPGTRWINNNSSVKQTGDRSDNSSAHGADYDGDPMTMRTTTTTTTINTNQPAGPNRPKKPEIQVEVFQQRVVDVETKLERIREGQPLDEQLHKLATIKLGLEQKVGRSHSWTDQLKGELASGAHDRKLLQAKYKPDRGQWSSSSSAAAATDRKLVSPLGRPIRRISQDDDDDD